VALAADARSLEALLGTTRAAVLAALDPGLTGAEVARRLTISAAAASRHIAVLGDAGLVTSRREGTARVHSLTPLGVALLKRPGVTGPVPVSLACGV
jgi:DNA-binding transcriptional ArsR family regulator